MEKQARQGHSFYEILGLDPGASSNDLAAAYETKKAELDSLRAIDEELVQKAMTLIERAYGTLSDHERRSEYDESLQEFESDDEAKVEVGLKEQSPKQAEVIELNEVVEENLEEPAETTVPKTPSLIMRRKAAKAKAPRLSGRLKATVTVPLATISRVIQQGGSLEDVDIKGDKTPFTGKNKNSLVDREQLKEQVNSYTSVKKSLEKPREPEQKVGAARMERRTADDLLMDDHPVQNSFLDYFLIFCAFILPLATVLLTAVHFLIPK